jgi:hypothetical protein
VAASHSYLQFVKSGSRDRDRQRQMEQPEGIRLVLGFRRVLLKLTCPSHAWNWPRPIQGQKPDGFDAHQTCFKCTTERFYNTRTLQAGPLYRSVVFGTEPPPSRNFAAPGRLRKWTLPVNLGRSILRLRKSLVR